MSKKKFHIEHHTLTLHTQCIFTCMPLTDGTFAEIPNDVRAELKEIVLSDLHLICKRMGSVLLQRYADRKEEWPSVEPLPTFYSMEMN